MYSDSTPRGVQAPAAPVTKVAKRRRLEAADAREAILASAEALLVANGPGGLRLTEVATRAGVSHPNVLYHFGTVAELQNKLAQRVTERLAEQIANLCDGEPNVATSIDCIVDGMFRVFDVGGYARLVAWLALSTNSVTFDALGEKLALVHESILQHPSLGGEEHAERRRRVVPAIELVIFAAIGYGLAGRSVGGKGIDRVTVAQLLGHLLGSPPMRTTTSEA